MRRRLVYLIVIVLMCLWTTAPRSCGGGYTNWDVTPNYSQGTPYVFTDDEREAILDEHNYIRASVGARNMLRLVSNGNAGASAAL